MKGGVYRMLTFISGLKDIHEVHCFEKDKLTGKILSSLYPESRVTIEGF